MMHVIKIPATTQQHHRKDITLHSSEREPTFCIHFMTYGAKYGRPVLPIETIMRVDCKDLNSPPRSLLDKYTGLDKQIVDSFFAQPGNMEYFHRMERDLQRKLDSMNNRTGCFAVEVFCAAGMHRSVSMARALQNSVEGKVQHKMHHLDLEHGRTRHTARFAAAKNGPSNWMNNPPPQLPRPHPGEKPYDRPMGAPPGYASGGAHRDLKTGLLIPRPPELAGVRLDIYGRPYPDQDPAAMRRGRQQAALYPTWHDPDYGGGPPSKFHGGFDNGGRGPVKY